MAEKELGVGTDSGQSPASEVRGVVHLVRQSRSSSMERAEQAVLSWVAVLVS